MTTEVAEARSFQERMFGKIREQMGTLLTDKELKEILEKSVSRAFFEPVVHKDGYGRTDTEEAHFIKLVRDLMKERVDAAIGLWIKEHEETVGKAVEETVAKGMLELVRKHIESKIELSMVELAESIKSNLGIRT